MDRMSRYRFCRSYVNVKGQLILSDRVPFRFVDLPDNERVKASAADTWWSIAATHFADPGAIQRPALLWWVVFDFQPSRPIDPTLQIDPGSIVHIPSLETLVFRILSESRKTEHK